VEGPGRRIFSQRKVHSYIAPFERIRGQEIRTRRTRKKQKEKSDVFFIFCIFNYHEKPLYLTFHQNSFLLTGETAVEVIKKVASPMNRATCPMAARSYTSLHIRDRLHSCTKAQGFLTYF